MAFNIRMGIPEMAELWNRLQTSYRNGIINKKDEELYKKWGNPLHMNIKKIPTIVREEE